MFRVVTIRYLSTGYGRQREMQKGPLHPDEGHVNAWANYLRGLGIFEIVRVESSRTRERESTDLGV